MRRVLRNYQLNALKYCFKVKHPALFLEMRLGKTCITIRRIRNISPASPNGLRVLVVAPSSALISWITELQLECEADFILLKGKRDHRLKLLNEYHKWNLINKEGFLLIPEIKDIKWDAVILDESTFIKNPKAKVSKFFCKNFHNGCHKFILTGMPVPESEMDIFQQLLFLDGKVLGHKNFWSFRSAYYIPPKYGYDWKPKPRTKRMIADLISKRAFILTRRDVKIDQPKIYEVRYLELPDKLKSIYKKAEDTFVLELEDLKKETKSTLVLYTYLYQMTGGHVNQDLIHDIKIKELINLLEGELAGKQIIIWFKFNAEIFSVKEALPDMNIGVITGADDLEDRAETINKFNEGKIRVLLLQIACAKYGLNLSKADTTIYYSRPLSNEDRMQSEDRILKAGEKHPLLYIDLVIEKTIDEDIYKLLKTKKFKANTLFELSRVMFERRNK